MIGSKCVTTKILLDQRCQLSNPKETENVEMFFSVMEKSSRAPTYTSNENASARTMPGLDGKKNLVLNLSA